MTSNVGSTAIAKGGRTSIGFLIAADESTSYAGIKALVMEELKAYFRPELLNRIDEVVVFHPLEKAQVCYLPCVTSCDIYEWKLAILIHGLSGITVYDFPLSL